MKPYRNLLALIVLLSSYSTFSQPNNSLRLIVESGDEMNANKDDVIFSSNNRFLALTSHEQVRIIDLKTGFLLKKINQDKNYFYPTFSGDFSHWGFTRLWDQSEKNDSAAFQGVFETFTNKCFYKGHYDKDNVYNRIIATNSGAILIKKDTVQIICENAKSGHTYSTSNWDYDKNKNLLLVRSHSSIGSYFLINLTNFDTLQLVNFDIKTDYNDQENYVMTGNVSFTNSAQYICFTGEYLYSSDKFIKIFDCEKKSIVFNKRYPKTGYSDDLFYYSTRVAPNAGVVTLPARNGLNVYNYKRNTSFFIPLTKKNPSIDVYLSANGQDVIINKHDSICVYNSTSGTLVFSEQMRGYSIIVNPNFNYVYFSNDPYAVDKQTIIFDSQSDSVVKRSKKYIVKTSSNGQLVYGTEGFKNYLFDPLLNNAIPVNNCTPYTEKIATTNEPGIAIIKHPQDCDFRNNNANFGTDFSIFDLNSLNKISSGDENHIYSFDDLTNHFVRERELFFSSGPVLNSFPDTMPAHNLEEKYGLLRCMMGGYFVFLPNNFNLVTENETPIFDSISVIKGDEVVSQFPFKHLYPPISTGFDTAKKQVIVLTQMDKDYSKNILYWYSLTGKVVDSQNVNLPNKLLGSSLTQILNADNRYLQFIFENYTTNIEQQAVIDYTQGKAICTLNLKDKVNFLERKFIAVDSNNFTQIGSFKSESNTQRIYPLAFDETYILFVKPAGNYKDFNPASIVLTQNGTYSIILMNWINSKVMYTGKIENYFPLRGDISTDHKLLAYALPGDQIRIFNVEKSEEGLLSGHTLPINQMKFCNNNKFLISLSFDGTNKIWATDSLKEILTFINLTGKDYLSVTPDGYYSCTKNAQNKFAFVNGSTILAPQQLDLFFDRPDIVLKRLGSSDQIKIDEYNIAWKKRIERLGFSENTLSRIFSEPKLEIENLDSFELITSKPSAELKIKAHDPGGIIKVFNVWVNNCPLYGQNGLNLEARSKDIFDTTVVIPLSDNDNTIEVSVTNNHGVESYRQSLFTRFNNPQSKKSKLWFIGIGINDYNEDQKKLKYAVKDIQNLNDIFKMAAKNLSIEYKTILLLESHATKSNIQSIKNLLTNVGLNDKIILTFSGHGVKKNKNYYLAPYDANFSSIESSGVNYHDLEDLLASLPSRNKLFLLDACYSGDFDIESASPTSDFGHQLANRKNEIYNKQQGKSSPFEVMQEIFTDESASIGATIISAARGEQAANEGAKWKNGAFTYCILQGLTNLAADKNKDGHITVNELKNYVSINVPIETENRQQTDNRKEISKNDWLIW